MCRVFNRAYYPTYSENAQCVATPHKIGTLKPHSHSKTKKTAVTVTNGSEREWKWQRQNTNPNTRARFARPPDEMHYANEAPLNKGSGAAEEKTPPSPSPMTSKGFLSLSPTAASGSGNSSDKTPSQRAHPICTRRVKCMMPPNKGSGAACTAGDGK